VNDLGAVIICGGRSSRMGRAKAWLPFGDEVLLQRVARVLAQVAAPIVVVAAPEQELPPLGDILVARDPVEGLGPLQGIAIGLDAIASHATFAFVSSTDAPFLQPAFVTRMRALCEGYDAAVPHADDHLHPLAAVYRTGLGQSARRLLDAGECRPRALFEEVCTHEVRRAQLLDEALTSADPQLWSLRNVNTPDDYDAALRDAGLWP
jgi:molybdopterin-guanine dinucleotide biosynthesis protein A